MTLTYYEAPTLRPDERVREAAVLASGALELMGDPVLARIAEDVRRGLRTQMAAVTIIHSDWQYLVAACGLAPGVDSRRTSFCGHAVASDEEVFVVPDARRDRRFAGNPVVTEGPRVRFYVAAPLIENGQPIGVLCAFDPRQRDGLDIAERAALRGGADLAVARIRERRLGHARPEITGRQRATLDLRGL
ncbi:GAF domain-containing protein [Sphingomonas guangdongensis]|uniref:GAF domain-containing protein n=1 Tax=Sphingomonas guangdongensis TaxID=1141890 RepID=A0A285QHQ1_9SPHN|nr:GAF domain-containing protein [Sphingomonas guangdongensis]SOB81004.1 GAF domain-containing protein [Sphingomonas guangdongensis]